MLAAQAWNVIPLLLVVMYWGYKNWQAHDYMFLRAKEVGWRQWRSMLPQCSARIWARDRGFVAAQAIMWAGLAFVQLATWRGGAPEWTMCVASPLYPCRAPWGWGDAGLLALTCWH